MIFSSIIKFPYPYIPCFNLKSYLKMDEILVQKELTKFERENIKRLIKKCLNSNFKINFFNGDSIRDFNYVNESLLFLKQVNDEYFNELNNSIKTCHLFVDDSKENMKYSGIFYHVGSENYYHVINDHTSKTFSTINHEIMHGNVSRLTNEKYDDINEYSLYREIASILIEIYSNDYLFMNKLISYDEYTDNFNEIFLINIYEQIEVVDVLYEMASKVFKKDNKTVKEFINKKKANNPNYNISIKELMEISLNQHLIYLYSTTIALSIYSQYQGNPKKGLSVAIEIMKNITTENEQQLLSHYNINFEDAINFCVEHNNKLLKKKS